MPDFKVHYFKNDLPSGLDLGNDIAIDCEMMGLKFTRDRLCTIQLCQKNERDVYLVHFENGKYDAPNLKSVLSNNKNNFIGHMIRLDLQTIFYYLGVLPTNVYCTRTASRIAQTYGASHNFSDLLKNHLNINVEKAQTSTYWGATNLTEGQIDYVAEDVIYLHDLKDKLNEIIISENRSNVLEAALKMIPHRVIVDTAGWENEDILSFPF